MHDTRTPRSALIGVAAALTAATMISACGNSNTAQMAAGAPTSGAAKRACSSLVTIDNTHVNHANGHDTGLLALAKQWRVVAAGSSGTATAAATTVAATIERAVAKGNTATLESSDGTEERVVHHWAYTSCGLHKINLAAQDHAFTGVPARVAAGSVALSIKNVGSVPHVLALARVNDTVHESMRKILTDPAKLFTKITLGPSSNPVRPGATDYLTAPLRPGRWLLVDPQAGNDGTPKFAHGLAAETQVGG